MVHKQSMLPSCGSLLFAGKLFSRLNTTNVYRHDSCYFFLVFLVAFTNKTSCHDIAEILMKVVLKTDI